MPLHVFELLTDARNECERAVKNSKIVVLRFFHSRWGGAGFGIRRGAGITV